MEAFQVNRQNLLRQKDTFKTFNEIKYILKEPFILMIYVRFSVKVLFNETHVTLLVCMFQDF